MLARVNDGFSGGKVTKTQLTSWIAVAFEKNYLDNSLVKIRKAHFDNVAFLEKIVAELKRTEKNSLGPPDMNAVLSKLRMAGKMFEAQQCGKKLVASTLPIKIEKGEV